MMRSCLCGRCKVDTRAFPRGTASEKGVLDCPDCESTPYIRDASASATQMGDTWVISTRGETSFFTDSKLVRKEVEAGMEALEPVFRHLDRSSTPEISPKLYRRGRGAVWFRGIELHPDARCVRCGQVRDTDIRGPLCAACEEAHDEVCLRVQEDDDEHDAYLRDVRGVWGASSITPTLLEEQAAENARQAQILDARERAVPNFYGLGGPWGPPKWYDFALPLLLTLQNIARRLRASLRRP